MAEMLATFTGTVFGIVGAAVILIALLWACGYLLRERWPGMPR